MISCLQKTMNLQQNRIPLSKLIAEHYYDLHHDIKNNRYTHYWLKGGRGSTKSSFISIEIINIILRDTDANAVVIRKVGNSIKDTVYEQIRWAIEVMGLTDKFHAKVNPMEIIYKPTGQKIIFKGLDDPEKVKSAKTAKGYFKII